MFQLFRPFAFDRPFSALARVASLGLNTMPTVVLNFTGVFSGYVPPSGGQVDFHNGPDAD